METIEQERQTAIHLLRAGKRVSEVAQQLKRSEAWVRKWRQRYNREGWASLQGQSKAPKQHGRRLPEAMQQAIRQSRSELEAEAAQGTGLKYIGGRAVRTRLQTTNHQPLPSKRTIERVLQAAGMTRSYQQQKEEKVTYPHLHPQQPHVLCQVDIAPHFLTGGQRVACFNAIDVVSRYPTGHASLARRSQEAAAFLLQVWQELGIPQYTQVDNEGCFSGGGTHPYILGRVVRLALAVGTELLFSPVQHPASNGSIERFHQDYDLHVWQGTYLTALADVHQQEQHFFHCYRTQHQPESLAGQTPAHAQQEQRTVDTAFTLPMTKLSLSPGRLHFIRRVQADNTVAILNVDWPVPTPTPL